MNNQDPVWHTHPLKNKVCIITGGTWGLGREMIMKGFVGNTKVFCSRQESIVPAFSKHIIADISFPEDAKRVVDYTISEYGRVDVLINNAGIYKRGSIEEMPPRHWSDVINTNLNGTFNMCHYCIPHMKEQNFGRIVNLTSYVMRFMPEERGAYTCSKIAINALTETLAKEVADCNIKVNCYSPWKMGTRMDIDKTGHYPTETAVLDIMDICMMDTTGKFYMPVNSDSRFELEEVEWKSSS